MPELIAISGAANANSFVTLAEARSILSTIPGADAAYLVERMSNTELSQWLLAGAEYLNGLDWDGQATADTQAMAWPRSYVRKPDRNAYFETTEIPAVVQKAQCLAAVWLHSRGDGSDGAITSFTGSGISLQYDRAGRDTGRRQVERLLSGLITSGRLMRA